MNIIIIDDDPLVVESLKTIVEANQIEVLAVGYDGHYTKPSLSVTMLVTTSFL